MSHSTLLPAPTVVRIRRKKDGTIIQDCDIYIGRRFTMGGWNLQESIWANPHRLPKSHTHDDRRECLDKYYLHLRSREDLLSQIYTLSGKRLGCFCERPKGDPSIKHAPCCHGDVLVAVFNFLQEKGLLMPK